MGSVCYVASLATWPLSWALVLGPHSLLVRALAPYEQLDDIFYIRTYSYIW